MENFESDRGGVFRPALSAARSPVTVVGSPISGPAGSQFRAVKGGLRDAEVPMARKRHSPESIAAVLRRAESDIPIRNIGNYRACESIRVLLVTRAKRNENRLNVEVWGSRPHTSLR